MLIENRAKLNLKNKNFYTVISIAGFKGNLEIVKLLFNAGADVSKSLEGPMKAGYTKIVELLIDAGADINYFQKISTFSFSFNK